MDIDLARRTTNQLDHIKEVVGTVSAIDVAPDGIQFNRATIAVSRIKEDADYEGVRVQFHATLVRARIPMQLDIGFGDVITPGPTEIERRRETLRARASISNIIANMQKSFPTFAPSTRPLVKLD